MPYLRQLNDHVGAKEDILRSLHKQPSPTPTPYPNDVTTTASGRVSSGIGELDRSSRRRHSTRQRHPLGAAIPAQGKSTLLMQTAAELTKQRWYYTSPAKNPASQLCLRAERLGVGGDIHTLAENDLFRHIESEVDRIKPAYVMIDSIQTMYSGRITPAQTAAPPRYGKQFPITRMGKNTGAATFTGKYVTKDGAIAGPRILEHMVDTVLYFGKATGTSLPAALGKNRFAALDEIGVLRCASPPAWRRYPTPPRCS